MDEEQLLARLTLVDDMSDKLLDIANAGMDMTSKLEQMSDTANAAFNSVSEQASRSVSAAEELSSAMNGLSNSSMSAANGADYWTSAVSGYDKSALEAVYSTEQLVEMGYKSADALLEQSSVTETLDGAMNALVSGMDSAVSSQNELSQAIDNANAMLEDSINAENMSAEAKQELEQASNNAADALKELERAQNEAQAAMENFDSIMNAEVLDTTALADAAEQASRSSEALASAQDKANSAVSELSKATEDASKSIEEMGEKSEDSGRQGSDALSAIAETAVAVAIADKVKDITTSVYEMSEAFSEAEKIVVNATGATGKALEGLDQSMMATFSTHHAELSDTAGAIGEINTRMGYTGEKLTDVTGKFLDFADITGSNVVTSVQNATKIMNKWNVEQDGLVSVLDKLAYEGQVSGASVDSLSSSLINGASSFQAMDLSLDSTISLLGALELQGINSSSVIMGLKTATKNFSKDGLDAASALRSTVDQIATMSDEAAATTLAIETFGSKAGVEMANAIRSGAITVEMLNGDLSEAEGTLQRTAQAGETLSEKWDKANNKITNALTNELQPTMDKVSGALAGVVGWIGDFINEHPVVIKILGAFAAGLGVVTVALTAYTVSVNLVIPALTKFAAALAANPIGLWVTVAATAVAVIGSLAVAFSDGADDVADYNGTLEECARDIDNTRLAHERAVELYGEESSAAKELEGQLDTLNRQYEKGGGALEDYAQRAQKGAEKFADFEKQYHERMDDITNDQSAALVMVAQLDALKDKANKTNVDLDLMGKYADYLNDTFECNIKVNYNTGELTGFDPKLITDKIINQMNQAMYQAEIDTLSDADFASGYVDALKQLPINQKDVEQTKISYDTAVDEAGKNVSPMGIGVGGQGAVIEAYNDWEKASETLKTTEETISGYENRIRTAFENIGLPAEEAERYIQNLKDTAANSTSVFDKMAESVKGLVHPMSEVKTEADIFAERYQSFLQDGKISTEELVSLVQSAPSEVQNTIGEFTTQVQELQTAYEDVYNSAYESYQGQYDLFEKLDYDTENHVLNTKAFLDSTVENAQAALDTQLSYWTQYSENMDYITSYSSDKLNVSKEDWNSFVAYLGSGTEEAAGLLNNVQTLLSEGNTEAVEELVNTQGKLKEIHGNTADDLAQFETDYDKKMQEIVKSTTEAIQSMEIPDKAKHAATSTMNAYIESLKLGGSKAISEAQSIAQRISEALNVNANVNVNTTSSGTVPGHAGGTTFAEDVFIAGENGPELIVGKQGSTVFPTSETEKIVNAVSGLQGSETALLENNSVTIPHTDNSLDELTGSLQSVFIPIMGKTVSLIDRGMNAVIASQKPSSDVYIINNDRSEGENNIVLPEHREAFGGGNSYRDSRSDNGSGTSEKHITIDINGGGHIEVSGNMDKESVLEVLQDNLKPVLIGIIEQEVYESGDDDYDY